MVSRAKPSSLGCIKRSLPNIVVTFSRAEGEHQPKASQAFILVTTVIHPQARVPDIADVDMSVNQISYTLYLRVANIIPDLASNLS
jgi:hypothetical protein